MKRISIAVALVALSSISVLAADLGARPITKAPPIDPTYNWSGFYIGANAGYGVAKNEHADITPGGAWWTAFAGAGSIQTIDPRGAVYGGQIGYNWQAANWVFGLEGQFNGADLKRTDLSKFYPDTDFLSSKINSIGTVTGRLGYAFNNWLPYIKGGYAAAHLETKNFDTSDDYLSHSAWRSGYVVGTGLEVAFAANWILGVEYNYMDFGGKSFSGTDIGGSVDPARKNETFNDNLKLQTVTARLSYKFGSPNVAKY